VGGEHAAAAGSRAEEGRAPAAKTVPDPDPPGRPPPPLLQLASATQQAPPAQQQQQQPVQPQPPVTQQQAPQPPVTPAAAAAPVQQQQQHAAATAMASGDLTAHDAESAARGHKRTRREYDPSSPTSPEPAATPDAVQPAAAATARTSHRRRIGASPPQDTPPTTPLASTAAAAATDQPTPLGRRSVQDCAVVVSSAPHRHVPAASGSMAENDDVIVCDSSDDDDVSMDGGGDDGSNSRAGAKHAQQRQPLRIVRRDNPEYETAAAIAAPGPAEHRTQQQRQQQQQKQQDPPGSGHEFLLQLADRMRPKTHSSRKVAEQQQPARPPDAAAAQQQSQQHRHRRHQPADAPAHQVPQLVGSSLVSRWPWHLLDRISWDETATTMLTATTPAALPNIAPNLWRAAFEPVIEAMQAGRAAAWKAWCLLPSLFYLGLPRKRSEARATLEARLRDWETGAWSTLLEQRRTNLDQAARLHRQRQQQQQQQGAAMPGSTAAAADHVAAALRRADRLVCMGEVSRAARALTQPEPPVSVDDRVLAQLQERHPRARAPPRLPPASNAPPAPEPTATTLTAADILEALRRSNRGAAQDMFGWRAEHVQLLPPETKQRLADLLARVADRPADFVPQELRPFLAGARLIALPKPGGSSVRPIAIGCQLRRLIAKALAMALRRPIDAALQPLQLGLSCDGAGTEIAIHLVRLARATREPGTVFAELDATNAFNAVDRSTVMAQVERIAPALLSWTTFCYAQPSVLLVQHANGQTLRISSERGVQQGDPLGPALFAMAHHAALSAAVRLHGGSVMAVAYLDDVGVVGAPRAVEAFAKDLAFEYGRIGLELNWDKSFAVPAIPHSRLRSVDSPHFLGAPVRPDCSPEERLDAHPDLLAILQRAPLLPHPQAALLLLRHVVGSAAMYTFRTTPPKCTHRLAEELDAEIRTFVAKTLRLDPNCLSSSNAASLATLQPPLGLGVPAPRLFFDIAYAASLLEALSPRRLDLLPVALHTLSDRAFLADLVTALQTAGMSYDVFRENGVSCKLQRVLTRARADILRDETARQAPPELLCRLRARAGAKAETAAWLRAPPCPPFDMRPAEFCAAAALWLGLAPPGTTERKCACGTDIDAGGHHLLTCPQLGSTTDRHNTVVAALEEALHHAGCSTAHEVTLSHPTPDHPDADLIIADLVVRHSYLNARPVAIDVAIVDSVTPARVQAAAAAPDMGAGRITALENAARRKQRKYAEVVGSAVIVFIPFIIDVSGAMHEQARWLVNWIADNARIPPDLALPPWMTPTPRDFWLQRLGTALQRGIGRAALDLLANPKPPAPLAGVSAATRLALAQSSALPSSSAAVAPAAPATEVMQH